MSDTHLIRSKHWYHLARNQLLERHPFAAGVAISLLQDSVETMCHAVATKVGAQVTQQMNFHQYWEKITSPAQLPLRTEMGDLNSARISYKHRGVLPDLGEAERFLTLAHQFLMETTRVFFDGKDFDAITEGDLISNRVVFDLVKTAEQELNNDDLEVALARCCDAVEEIEKVLDSVVLVSDRRKALPRPGSKEDADIINWTLRMLIAHDRALSLISIGANPSEYWLLRAMLPQKSLGGTYQRVDGGGRPRPTSENVAEIIRIIIRLALKVNVAADSISRIASPFVSKSSTEK